MTISEIRLELERRKGRREQVRSQMASLQQEIQSLCQQGSNIQEAQALLQTVAKATQEQLEYHISEIVSLALSAVFPDPYRLELHFELRRGKSEADLLFRKKDGEAVFPLEASGGGPVDVAAFGLRIALWSLQNPRSRNCIILDEPFRFVSRDLQPRASAMLKQIAERLKLQMILVTHEPNLTEAADRVFEVTIQNRESTVITLTERPESLPEE